MQRFSRGTAHHAPIDHRIDVPLSAAEVALRLSGLSPVLRFLALRGLPRSLPTSPKQPSPAMPPTSRATPWRPKHLAANLISIRRPIRSCVSRRDVFDVRSRAIMRKRAARTKSSSSCCPEAMFPVSAAGPSRLAVVRCRPARASSSMQKGNAAGRSPAWRRSPFSSSALASMSHGGGKAMAGV